MSLNLQQKSKIRKFFEVHTATAEMVELFQRFILPFVNLWVENSTNDLEAGTHAFFAVNERKFYEATARRKFILPGELFISGARTAGRNSNKVDSKRVIEPGQKLLIAADKVDRTARVQLIDDTQFLLKQYELDTIKDWVEMREI